MHGYRGVFRNHCWRSFTVLFFIVLFLTACSKNSEEGFYPEYNGVKYTGEGTLETKVDVAIFNEDEALFVQTVKIMDDHPTVGKVMQAISDDDEQGVLIEKDQEGQILSVDGIVNDENKHWVLSINNVIDEGNTEEIEIGEDQSLTLIYTADP
ncbi:hypothetical protein [Paenibacillus sp. FSL W7-1332]|uniref:hypothetical protein n=1 Tax=Paenibacillus sp. FSL W7-1332 TaxID=2921702 RepID=UPI0030CCECC8